MSRRTDALGWGLVGTLSFLVLHQAYLLVGGTFLGFLPVATVAVVVGVVTTVSVYYVRPALDGRRRQ